jgi:hypothetical protein
VLLSWVLGFTGSLVTSYFELSGFAFYICSSTCGSLIIVCIFHNCSGSNADQMLSGVDFVWPALMIASSAFQAGASIIKEFIFTDAATRLKGRSLDLFVVNSLGSGFQVIVNSLG